MLAKISNDADFCKHDGITGDILQKNRFLRPTSKEIRAHSAVDKYIFALQGAPTEVELQKLLRP